jgi:ribosomal-protein-alanine N-acetyltransferase
LAEDGALTAMLGLDFVKGSLKPPVLTNGEVFLRTAEFGDFAEWCELREASRAHLTRWEPDWNPKDVTLDAFRTRVRAQQRELRIGASLPFFVFRHSDGALVGAVNLTDIRYQALCSATVGYWIGARFLRRGYALAGVEAILRHGFDVMGLNRIEAACQPHNEPSRNLLAKAGFHEEGISREYLFINGAWRDHVRLALTARECRDRPLQP